MVRETIESIVPLAFMMECRVDVRPSRQENSIRYWFLCAVHCILLVWLPDLYRKKKDEGQIERERGLCRPSILLRRLPGVASFMERCWAGRERATAIVSTVLSLSLYARRPGIGQPWNDRPPPRLNGFSHRLYEEINVLASVWQNNESKNGRRGGRENTQSSFCYQF